MIKILPSSYRTQNCVTLDLLEHHWTLFSANGSSLLSSTLFLYYPFQYYLSIYTWFWQMVVSLQVIHPKFHMPFSFHTCLVHAPCVTSLLLWSSRDSEHALKPVLCLYICLTETCFCLEEQRNCQPWTLFLYFPSVTFPLLNTAHCCTECEGSMLLHNTGFHLKNYVLPHLPNKYIYILIFTTMETWNFFGSCIACEVLYWCFG